MLETHVRSAESFSVDEVMVMVDLVNSAYHQHEWLFPTDRTSRAGFQQEAAGLEILLLIREDEIVAIGVIQPKDDALFLKMAAVRPDCQGQGYGKNLLSSLEAIALERGFIRLELMAVAEVGNVDYYLKQGFRPVTESVYEKGDWGARDRFTVVTMEKRIRVD